MNDFSSYRPSLFDVDIRRVSFGTVPYSKDELPASFPYSQWSQQVMQYIKYWRHFTGEVWREEIPNQEDEYGNPVLMYPLQINFIKTIAMKHNYVLWGEVSDSAENLVPIRCLPRQTPDDKPPSPKEKRKAKEAEIFLNQVWKDNYSRSLLQEAGLVQQFLGGTIIKVSYTEDMDIESGIRVEQILPDFFFPVFDSARKQKMLEAWVIYRMNGKEAQLRFGFDPATAAMPVYVEHWTEDTLEITLNGKPLIYQENGVTFDYTSQMNPYGFVPFVYIPRELAGGYYGLSIVDDLEGLAKEYNSRLAYLGDILKDTADRTIFVKNMPNPARSKDLGLKRKAVDLGMAAPVSDPPDIDALEPPKITDAQADYPDMVRKQMMRDGFISGVVDGEDEGSQRSALTLYFRMWPLVAKVRAIRNNWTTGFIQLSKMMIRIAAIFDLSNISVEHLKLEFEPEWSPMVPRDREQDFNEIVTAVQTDMLSPITAMDKLDLVRDSIEEYEQVKEYMKLKSELEVSKKLSGKLGSKNREAGGQDASTRVVE